ncbi:epimerase [Thiomicrorhabdus immobilis]|uniref:Epimerase n=1 Tax=Thiomicrorhabdus immobilis TaxID=2791037 RepID=A0ABN6CZ04_9GAMM|nr:TIGR01777 family oxidoreductase [Thiomicrorhabdus immobilis]BCN94336.1 epimerase [Thiomicrorhabdus immobilis]
MKVMILGGTGFVGRYLEADLLEQGFDVKVYGREAFQDGFDLSSCLENQDLLIMLAGENIGRRWSKSYKTALLESRTITNQKLKQSLQACQNPPKRIFSASAIGFYPESDCQHPVDETCTKAGSGFLGELSQQWEQASLALSPKPVIMRFGVVLGKNGGALQKMLPPFRFGLGGPVAGGQQCFSWIHIEDLARAVNYLIDYPEFSGVFNLTSPNPVTNRVFGQCLAQTLNRPFWLPLPEFQLKLMFGEGAQVLTHSSAVLPRALLEKGFYFLYPKIDGALQQILHD